MTFVQRYVETEPTAGGFSTRRLPRNLGLSTGASVRRTGDGLRRPLSAAGPEACEGPIVTYDTELTYGKLRDAALQLQ